MKCARALFVGEVHHSKLCCNLRDNATVLYRRVLSSSFLMFPKSRMDCLVALQAHHNRSPFPRSQCIRRTRQSLTKIAG
jgi:hypothetical protein